MTAESITGNALHSVNAGLTSQTAMNIGTLGLEALVIGGIAVYTYKRIRKALRSDW